MADGSIKFDTELDSGGLVSGLGELAGKTKSSMGEVSKNISSELGEAFAKIAEQSNSESKAIASDAIAAQKLYESESERIQNRKKNSEALYLEQLKENVEKIKLLRDEELKSLKTSYDLGLIDAQEYFSRLADWRDRYFEYGTTGWQSYTAEILKYNKKLSDEQEKALTDAAETVSKNIKKRYDDLLKQQESLREKLADFGGISRKNTIAGDKTDIEFTTYSDMNAQIKQLEQYSSLIGEVKKRSDEFWRTDTDNQALNEKNAQLRSEYFEQIRKMNVDDAIDFANSLLGATDEKFISYLGGFEKKQELAKQISKQLFSSEVSDAADSSARQLGGEFSDALAEELEGLSGKFFSSGEEACKSFGEGFMSKLDSVLSQLSEQITAGAAAFSAGTNVENNTSYNIYGAATPEDTIRALREREEMKQLMIQ